MSDEFRRNIVGVAGKKEMRTPLFQCWVERWVTKEKNIRME